MKASSKSLLDRIDEEMMRRGKIRVEVKLAGTTDTPWITYMCTN